MSEKMKPYAKVGIIVLGILVGIACIQYCGGMFGFLLAAFIPLIIGAAVAYVVNVPMTFLARHFFPKKTSGAASKMRAPISLILAYVLIVAAVLLVIVLLAVQLPQAVEVLIKNFPQAMNDLAHNKDIAAILPKVSEELRSIDWNQEINTVVTFLKSNAGGVMGSAMATVMSVITAVVNFVIGVVFSTMILGSKEQLIRQANALAARFLSPAADAKLHQVMATANRCFHGYLVGQCVQAVIMAVVCIIAMLLLGLPYALSVGVLVGFCTLIPMFGIYIGAIIGTFMVFTASPIKALVFLVLLIVLQQIQAMVVSPKFVNNAIGLPGLWVMVALTLGGALGGMLGMLIAVPLGATIYQLLRQEVKGNGADSDSSSKLNSGSSSKPSPKAEAHKIAEGSIAESRKIAESTKAEAHKVAEGSKTEAHKVAEKLSEAKDHLEHHHAK